MNNKCKCKKLKKPIVTYSEAMEAWKKDPHVRKFLEEVYNKPPLLGLKRKAKNENNKKD